MGDGVPKVGRNKTKERKLKRRKGEEKPQGFCWPPNRGVPKQESR